MRNLWQDIRNIYGSAWAFALACPLLFMIPVLFEFVQHIIEIKLGLYDSVAGAKAAENDPSRMQWGFLKTLALGLPTYWFYRYVVSGRDAAYAGRLDGRALSLWAIIFVVMASLNALALFGPALGDLVGLQGQALIGVKIALAVGQILIGIYLTVWFVAWSQGTVTIGPRRSIRLMKGYLWRTIALMVAGILPLMALHYAGLVAIGKPEPLVWAIMIFDSVVVGFLALTMHGVSAVAALRAADVKGVDLLAGSSAALPADAISREQPSPM